MSMQIQRPLLASLGIAALFVVACQHEGRTATEGAPVLTTTSAAVIPNEAAIARISKARCERASECNILGNGRAYSDKSQCMDAYMPGGGALANMAYCVNGADRERLDKCVAVLADQHCDVDLGPETAMPECRSYCVR